MHLYTKDPSETKNQLLMSKRKSVDWKHYNDSKALNEYSNNMACISEINKGYNLNKECKILIVFDCMISDILSKKKLNKQKQNKLLTKEN